MALRQVYSGSSLGFSEIVDLFQLKSSQTIVKNRYFDMVKAKNEPLEPGESVIFELGTQATTAVLLNESCIEIEGKIQKREASTGNLVDIVEGDIVGPTNYFLQNLWHKADVSSNEVDMTRVRSCTNHVCYVRMLLNDTTNPVSDAELSGQMACRTESDIEATDPFAETGAAETFKDRATEMKLSKTVCLRGRLGLDLFELDRLWLPGTPLTIKLTQNDSKCILIAPNNNTQYKFVLEKVHLVLCKYKLYSSGKTFYYNSCTTVLY